MAEKVGFTNCVFVKLCFPENTIFIVFSAKHSFSKTKTVCWKNRKFMKNSGLFWTWQNGVLGVCFFVGFNVKKVFWCVWYCFTKVLKILVFPVLGGFSGVDHCCSSGFGRFRCFCVSGVCFSFLSGVCFCFVCFVLGLVVGCCCFVFLVFFLVVLCCFVGSGEVARRATSLGPKPSLFYLFWFCFCFSLVLFYFFVFFCFLFVLFFLEGLRVRWGGPKGHLTWR